MPSVETPWEEWMLCWRQGCVGGGVGCSILDTCLQEPLRGSGPCGAGGSRMLGERMRSPALLPKDTREGRGVQEPHSHLWQREQEFASKLDSILRRRVT